MVILQHLAQAVHTHTPSWRRLMFSSSTGFPTLCRRWNNEELPANVDPKRGGHKISARPPLGTDSFRLAKGLLTVFDPTAITNDHDGFRVSRFTRGSGRRTLPVRGAPSSAAAHTVPKRSQHGGPIVHRRKVLCSLLGILGIEPRVQQYEQVASRL
jgi:hypothetical protein